MVMFSYNYYKNLNRPLVYLAFPNKHILGIIQARNFQTDFFANSMDKGSFKVNQFEDGVKTPYYDSININMYIFVKNIGWFIITEMHIINNGINEYKEITYISLEHELSKKYLTSFGSLGVETDEQGGLDRYCLYNRSDIDHSIMHIVINKNPDWNIGYIDSNISSEYRNFQVDSIDTYTFLTQNVSEAYDCVFLFNSDDKTISAYSLDNLGSDTGITLSYRNFIKSVDQKSDDDEVKTVLTVVGGNDERTNTPLGIMDVNISGSNQICNFSYFLHMMSEELQNGLKNYEFRCKENESAYNIKLAELKRLYIELNDLNNKVPSNHNSTNWGEYGLVELLAKEKVYKINMSSYTSQEDASLFKQNSIIHQAIEQEIAKRKTQIISKENAIVSCQNQAASLAIKLDEFLGEKLYKELSAFVKEDTLTDDSFIATTVMTDSEIIDMQRELLNHARKELYKVCYPKFEAEIDLINFTVNYDYKKFTDKLELFNIIHIQFDEPGVIGDARLLKLHVNWDDPSDFSATFSNKDSLNEIFSLLKEIQEQAQSTATQIGFSSGAWKDAAQSSKQFKEYQNAIFDASLKQIQSSANQECIFDETGLMLRRWLPEQGRYDPHQMWLVNNQLAMTLDGWNSVSLALGYVKIGSNYFYGLNAEHLLGKITITEQLYIMNSSGTYSITKDGLLAKNGSYQVKINPNTPSDIFSISIDNKKLLYVDANTKKLKFEGDIESISGHIANYVISENSLTSGGVGMSSDATKGAKSFWAGNANSSSAPFWVDNTGKLHASKIEVTGGSLKIGNYFDLDADGLKITTDKFKLKKDGNAEFGGLVKAATIEGSSITGGSIDIGNGKFTVDKNGHLTAKSGTFSGTVDAATIKGSSITGGTIDGTTITGGTLKIGDNFTVDKNGKLTAVDGKFSGHITGSSINIGDGNFVVEENGKMTSKGGIFEGGEIRGSSIDIGDGKFTVNSQGNMTAKSAKFVRVVGGREVGFEITDSGLTGLGMSSEIKAGNVLTPSLMVEIGNGVPGNFAAGKVFSAVIDSKTSEGEVRIYTSDFEVNGKNILEELNRIETKLNQHIADKSMHSGSSSNPCSCDYIDDSEECDCDSQCTPLAEGCNMHGPGWD